MYRKMLSASSSVLDSTAICSLEFRYAHIGAKCGAAPATAISRRSEIASWLKDAFGAERVAIGMVHLPALPGSPLYDAEAGVALVRERTRADLQALQVAGFDAVMFCNENDRPYVFTAGSETVAAMAAVIGELRHLISVPFGVDVLWDPRAALAVARATGALFVREIFTGAYGSEFGIWNTSPGETLRYRRQIGATDVRILTNISAEFAAPLVARPIDVVARGVSLISLADAICISGPMTGASVDDSQLRAVRTVLPDTVIFANTGVNEATVGDILALADGVVVGTSLKVDGVTWNPIDEGRARDFMRRVREARTLVPAHAGLNPDGR
jgi:membrane complex biogenesis BtpA family protein